MNNSKSRRGGSRNYQISLRKRLNKDIRKQVKHKLYVEKLKGIAPSIEIPSSIIIRSK